MRIGIDATCWANPRGYGRFARHMLTALLEIDRENEYVFFIDSITAATTSLPANVEQVVIKLSEAPAHAASAYGRRRISDIVRMSRAVSRVDLDLFFFASVYTYFPVRGRCRKIVAFHDVIAEKYPELIFRSWKYRQFWNLKARLALWQSDLVLTVSQFSKQGIAEHFSLPAERIRVVTEGSADSFGPVDDRDRINAVLTGYGLEANARYILYVGGIAPHKNLAVLVEAYSKLITQERYADIRLIMVGDYEHDVFLIDEQLKAGMNYPQFREKVIYTGYVSDADLNCLYNGAQIFALPSFCEGFGLPALEAMSCGTVVIASNTTSVPEVVGEAGLFFDPYSAQELEVQLRTLLDDNGLRERLGQCSIERAATFSWQQSAADTLAVFNDAVR